MGYTHFWTQLRSFSPEEWECVSKDIQAIIECAKKEYHISLADSTGQEGSKPVITSDLIGLNGVEGRGLEPFEINRVCPTHPSDGCKTGRSFYDAVVVACLCYLASVHKSHNVTSDGDEQEWKYGLELAQKALPSLSIAIPETVLEPPNSEEEEEEEDEDFQGSTARRTDEKV